MQVNGKSITAAVPLLLAELLKQYDIDERTPAIAVAVNDHVTPRSKWAETEISDGDRVEIVHAVQGG